MNFNQEHKVSSLSSKKIETSDKFHTYRVRMARLSAVQACYLKDFNDSLSLNKNNGLFDDAIENKSLDLKQICEDVFFYYRTIFFGPVQYGFNQKNKKIDEIYSIRLIENWNYRKEEIDNVIKSFLREDWTVQRLDPIMRAVLRIATTEAIIATEETTNSIISSEYTNIAANFFTGKMIGFANGIIDNIIKKVRKIKQ